MSDLNAIRASLERRLPASLQFLENLVRVNSFTANPDGVNRNAEIITKQFAPLGFTPRQVQCANPGTGSHLILEKKGPGVALACISHLDTVYPPEEEIRNNFYWQVEGNRIFGPGTVDIKGGTAMLWLLVSAFAELEKELFEKTHWVLLWNAAEETLSLDFANLSREILPAKTRACLIFEGDGRAEEGFAAVRGRKGRGVFQISVSGRGSHAGGKHHEGANAIHQAARVVEKLAALTDYHVQTTVNVGTIRGGTVVNRVPHDAFLEVEMRASNLEFYRATRDAILALSGSGTVLASNDGFPCGVSVRLSEETAPWPENRATDQLVTLWKSAAQAAGLELEADFRGGLSDGNYLWEKYPTIDGLGPRGNHAHVSERSADNSKIPEYVDASSFVPKGTINFLALLQLLP